MSERREELQYLLERMRCYEPERYAVWEERAAIIEYGAHKSRDDAEWEAYLIVSSERWL